MRRRALLSVVGTSVLAGCGGRLDDAPDTQTPTTSEDERTMHSTTTETTIRPAPTPELGQHELVRTNEESASELVSVVGRVRNPTDETFEEITVTAAFEDADETVLDRATGSVDDFAPDERWSFELVYAGTGEEARAVTSYSLAVATTE